MEIREEFLFTTMQDHKMQMQRFTENGCKTHPLENGFAHAYVASDGILYAEDDAYAAWHCGQTDGNRNYYSIEVCQSMGDLEIFKKNEENALKLAAQKCKQYGIVPNTNTIRLHKEVFANSVPAQICRDSWGHIWL